MDELSIAYLGIEALKPDPGNARTHSPAQIAQISASIDAYGFTNPILIDETGGIIAGHGRLLAAKLKGLDRVPTITLRGLTQLQKKALRLADNKIALNAGWDFELVKVTIEELKLGDFDLSLTGFSIGEVDVILDDAPDPDDEVIPATPVTPISRPGDIWRLGRHRVGCFDVRDKALLDKLMQGETADAAFLDPPYNQPARNIGNRGRTKHRDLAGAAGEKTPAEFTAWLKDVLSACAGVSRNGAVHFVCMDHQHILELLQAAQAVYAARLNLAVWNKSNAGMGSLYRSKHELIGVFRVGEESHRNNVELGKHGRNRTNVWDYTSVNTFRGSPARRPQASPHGQADRPRR